MPVRATLISVGTSILPTSGVSGRASGVLLICYISPLIRFLFRELEPRLEFEVEPSLRKCRDLQPWLASGIITLHTYSRTPMSHIITADIA
jgi:hypothetical protein